MRKVTALISVAFLSGRSLSVGNTRTDGKSIFLHGNEIVKKKGKSILISDAGWPTVTTRERINGLLEVMVRAERLTRLERDVFSLFQRKGVQLWQANKPFPSDKFMPLKSI